MYAGESVAASENGYSVAYRPAVKRRVRYDNVHDLKEHSELVGWELDCHKIEPGDLMITVTARKVGRVLSMNMEVDGCVELLGSPPNDRLTLIIPGRNNGFWANGYNVKENHALLVCPDARMHLMARATAFYLLHIPISLLREFSQAARTHHLAVGRDGAAAVRLPDKGFASLLQLINRLFVDDNYAAEHVQDALVASASSVIRQAIKRSQPLTVSRSESWRTISRAREFIEANLRRPIRMRQVSGHTAASVSKLERTFKRELSITPGKYILARRLHAVHRDLGSVFAADANVSDLAMHYGFRHLGRFSATYRSYFGELPSQTLQAVVEEASSPSTNYAG